MAIRPISKSCSFLLLCYFEQRGPHKTTIFCLANDQLRRWHIGQFCKKKRATYCCQVCNVCLALVDCTSSKGLFFGSDAPPPFRLDSWEKSVCSKT